MTPLAPKGGVPRKDGAKVGFRKRVDTNTSAHNPTDPFTAFQTLRTLLESTTLSSRKQMTPEEHKLSLRLLDIVEPFLGAIPARKNLITQPTEILDEIVYHIDSRHDLISFALTCGRMYRVIHPRHYEYRVIRAKISSIAIWHHLIENKILARGVRHLELLDERSKESEIIPSNVVAVLESRSPDSPAQLEQLLVETLQSLPALSSFTWSCSHASLSLSVLWDTLLHCDNLKNVEIQDNLVFSSSTAERTDIPVSDTTSLKSIAIKTSNSAYGFVRNPSLDRVSNMLIDRCPNLEDLNIGYEPVRSCGKPRADDFLSNGRWSNLRNLTLRSLWCSAQSGADAIVSFLAEHSKLETLSLDLGRHTGSNVILLPNSLPLLRELTTNKELATAIMRCPLEGSAKRPLEVLRGVGLSGPAQDQPFFDALKMHDIKRLELARFNDLDDLRRLVECVPKLTWLDVGTRCNYKTGPLTIPNAGEWATMLSQLPELVAFHGIHVFYDSLPPEKECAAITHSERSRVVKNNETANVLAWKVPKLRRLDHWEDGSGKIVVLIREGEKVRWEVRRSKT